MLTLEPPGRKVRGDDQGRVGGQDKRIETSLSIEAAHILPLTLVDFNMNEIDIQSTHRESYA